MEDESIEYNKVDLENQFNSNLMMIGFEAMVQSDLLTQQIKDLEHSPNILVSQTSLKLIKSGQSEDSISR